MSTTKIVPVPPKCAILGLVALLSLAAVTPGQTTWTGALGSGWGDFQNWTSGVPNFADDVTIPSGTPNAPSTAGAATLTCRNLTVASGASLTVATGFDLSVAGTVSSPGMTTGSGILILLGTANRNLSGNLCGVEIAVDPTTSVGISTSTIGGDFTLTSGSFTVNFTHSTHVTGNAAFNGGALVDSGAATIDVDGDVVFAGTTCSNSPRILCGGNWTADSAYAPTDSDEVKFDGSSPQVIMGAMFPKLTIAAGSTVTATSPLTMKELDVDGAFTAGGDLDVNGLCHLSGTIDLGSHDVFVSSTFSCNAALTATGTFFFDGSTNGGVSASTALPRVEVTASSGVNKTFSSVAISGDLVHTSGNLVIGFANTTHVMGNAFFNGGALIDSGAATLDVDGDVHFAGATCTNSPGFRCGGNWTADSAYAPTDTDEVKFDGSTPQVIMGAVFPKLTIAAGSTATATSPLTMKELDVDGAFTAGGDLDVNGLCHLSGTVDLGSHDVFVSSTFSCNAALTATGTFFFDGATNGGVSGSSPLPRVEVTASSGVNKTFSNVAVSGDLVHTSGNLVIGFATTTHVMGNAFFNGGALIDSGAATLDVDGDVNFSGTTCTNSPGFRCGGNWTADSAYAPTDTDEVRFDGSSPQVIMGAMFPKLTIAAGSTATATAPLIMRDLDVDGAFTAGGDLDVNGTCHLSGVVDLGSHDVFVSSTFSCNAALTATGTVVFDGATTSGVSASTPLPRVEVAASSGVNKTFNGVTVSGDLVLTSGNLGIGFATTTHVMGSAFFNGGALIDGGAATLDVDGDVNFSGTTCTNSPGFRCGGNWNADSAFAPTDTDEVKFDGSSPQVIMGAMFPKLTIAAGSTATATAPLIMRDLDVDGAFTTGGDLDVNGTCHLSGVVDLGSHDVFVSSTFSCNAALTATGTVVFDGATTSGVSASTPLPRVEVAASSGVNKTFNGVTVSGDLVLTSGNLGIGFATTTQVMGNAFFNGGALIDNGAALLDVDGDVHFAGTTCTNSPGFRCGGNWTADSAYAPTDSDEVLFDGAAPQIIAGATFPELAIAAGSTATATSAMSMNELDVDGSFTAGGDLDVDGVCNLAGTVALGMHDLYVSSTFTCSAAVTGTGTVLLDGTGSAAASSSTPLPRLEVATAAGVPRTFNGLTASELVLTSGILNIGFTTTTTVLGNATFNGGMLGTGGAATIDVDGDVTFAGTNCISSPNFLCGGNWDADAAFAPTNTFTVTLDGNQTTTISAPIAGATMPLGTLIVRNGTRSALVDLVLDTSSIHVEATGGLDAGATTLSVPTSPIMVDGTLSVGAGGTLAFGAGANVVVAPSGTLAVLGSTSFAASVAGHAGGGYGLTVDGTLAAQHFVFTDMNASGIKINQNAIIAPAPNDLRGGRFDRPAGTGGPLLDIRRTAPATLSGLEFENTNGNAGFNVRCTSGSGIVMDNSFGAFAGPNFEDDPNDLIFWAPPSGSQLGNFTVTSLAETVRVSWMTTLEIDVLEFRVARSSALAGPYAAVATASPGVFNYEILDTGLAAGQTFWYRLEQVNLSDGATVVLATATATPYSASPPPNVLDVGPAAPFADVQTAIDAATLTNTIVRIAPGTYPSFTVGSSVPDDLRIIGDGTGTVTIDTTAGPVMVINRPFGHAVTLEGIEVGSPTSAQDGIVIVGCQATVLLNGVTAASMNSAVRIELTSTAAMQNCDFSGTPGLLSLTSRIQVVGGTIDTLDLRTQSVCQSCDVIIGTTLTDPTVSNTAHTGIMPVLSFPRTTSVGYDMGFSMQTNPFDTWYLLLDSGIAWYDPSNPALELVGLVNADDGITYVGAGLADATGLDARIERIPANPALIGIEFTFQGITYDFLRSVYRWSTVAPVLLLP